MNLKDLMAADLETVFFNVNGHGETATYNGVETVVIPDIGEGNSRKTTGYERQEIAFFSVMASVAPNPRVGDILVHNDIEWQFIGAVSIGKFRHKLKFTTNESAVILR